jgi:hypothetical protein
MATPSLSSNFASDYSQDTQQSLLQLQQGATGNPARVDSDSTANAAIDDAAALMARLSSQFGDLDLEQLNKSLLQGEEDVFKTSMGIGPDDFPEDEVDDTVVSEESSLEDPTPDELAAWQAQQFQKGKETLRRRKEETMDPIQKRRLTLHHRNNDLTRSSDNHDDFPDDDGDWEEIAAYPDLQGQTSVFFNSEKLDRGPYDGNLEDGVMLGVSPLLRTLATSPNGDPELLGTAWLRLYSSVEGDGLSFFNLCHEICHYDGPTLMLFSVVPSKSRMVVSKNSTNISAVDIGFFTTTTWQACAEYNGNYSDHDTAFLFAMDDDDNRVDFFGMTKKSSRNVENRSGYMYCYPSTKSAKSRFGHNSRNDSSDQNSGFNERTDGAVHGIGIGGTPSQPRFHLTETLEECRCLPYDTSRNFQDGNLFLGKPAFEDSLYHFDVESIEVWGVGGKAWIRDALEAREKARQNAASNLQRRRRIYDKSQMLDDFRNGIHSTTAKSAANGSYFDHMGCASDRCDL